MAALGQVRKAYWPGCSPARQAYVASFRALIGAMPTKKQGARAKYLRIPLGTLSNYWTGRRVPSAVKLRAMYDAVSERKRTDARLIPFEHLEEQRKTAALRGAVLASPQERSDIKAAGRISLQAPAPKAIGAPAGDTAPSGTVPAHGPAQDRHNNESGKVGETVGALRAAQAAGDRRAVIGIAWSASRTLTHGELCTAAAELYASGDAALGEALLLSGRERSQEESIRLAIALMSAGLTTQAELVMRAALPPGGNEQA
ncbi:hypothetical protein [Streptomyces sp. NPDC089799]|uniref:hypothetical protein n=1 Tax=Streptomyces sp. NPDC089799 TaxID=3155066 RepID=UPI00341D5A67